MYHETTVVGRVGETPKLRYLQSGAGVCNFSVAVSKRYKKGDEWQETTVWYRVAAWERLGERINEGLQKGQIVTLMGEVSASAYTKDGEARATLNLKANRAYWEKGKSETPAQSTEDFAF